MLESDQYTIMRQLKAEIGEEKLSEIKSCSPSAERLCNRLFTFKIISSMNGEHYYQGEDAADTNRDEKNESPTGIQNCSFPASIRGSSRSAASRVIHHMLFNFDSIASTPIDLIMK
jgi:hypothetical protein